ncbi:MAG: nuclear transport factor 2 family protein [Actinomycetota bacterium]|nr:nuclear transport factor 2 family protein [Actinomycetota bacterium]
MSDQNMEIARRAGEAIGHSDAEALGALMAPECEIVPMRAALEGTVYRGPDAAARFVAAVDEVWENLSGETEALRDGGDWVLAFARFRGRGRTSGVDQDVQMAAVYRFRDGVIASLRLYSDRAEALAAVGLAREGNARGTPG